MGQGNIFGKGSYGLGWALPRLDEALSALLEDLYDRGLLKNTLVVVVGEFGRTPKIETNNGISGRSHWPACFSALLAGATRRASNGRAGRARNAARSSARPVVIVPGLPRT